MKIVECIVHKITMGDVEDPDLYVAEPIWKWQQTDAGKWVMENAVDTPIWHRNLDGLTWSTVYTIHAKLKDIDYTYFKLKFQ